MTHQCLAGCTGPAQLHHPTGRIGPRYADPDYTVPLCADCHKAAHAQLRALGLDDPAPVGDPLLAAEIGTRRLGVLAHQLVALGDRIAASAELAADHLSGLRGAPSPDDSPAAADLLS